MIWQSNLQNAAVKALTHFVQAYQRAADDRGIGDVTLKYLNMLTDPNVAVRRGSALAIGVLPREFLSIRWRNVLQKLCHCCRIEVVSL